MARTYCKRCGGPGWRDDGCRLCWLTSMTSQEVIWHDQERAGLTAEGEAIGSVMVWSTMDDPDFDPVPFNSTADTAATSDWLPDGATDYVEPRDHQWDEGNDRYQRLLRAFQWR